MPIAPILPHPALVLIALAAFVQPTEQTEGGLLEQISYAETGARGVGETHWYIWPNGAGRYVHTDQPDGKRVEASLAPGREEVREIAAMLAPLEDRQALVCRQERSDQANGRVTWARGIRHVVVHLDHGCLPAPGEQAFDRLAAANARIRKSAEMSVLLESVPGS